MLSQQSSLLYHTLINRTDIKQLDHKFRLRTDIYQYSNIFILEHRRCVSTFRSRLFQIIQAYITDKRPNVVIPMTDEVNYFVKGLLEGTIGQKSGVI